MEHLKVVWQKAVQDLQSFTWQDRLILLTVVLLFLPFYLSAPLIMALLFIPLFKRELWPDVLHQKGALWLYGFIFLEILVSWHYGNSMGILNSLGYMLVGVYIAFYRKVIHPRLYYYVIQTFLIMSVFAAVWGLVEFWQISRRLGYSFWSFTVEDKPGDRIHAMYYNANFYATMLDFFLIFASCSLIKARSRISRIYFILLIALNFFLLLLTGCRAALLPLIFYIPVFLWASGKKKLFYIVVSAEAVLIISVLVQPELIPRFDDMSTVNSRLKIWAGAVELIRMHPIFGMGPQTYGYMYKQLGLKKAPHAHSIYLDSLASFGLAGTALILGYIFTILQEIRKKRSDPRLKYYRPMVACFLISAAIHGLLDCTLNFWQTGMVFMMIFNSAAMVSDPQAGKKKAV